MSLGKRQLSGSKLKFDADYYKNALEQQEKKRPGSGQPLSTITSPLPPRKPVYSGKLRSIIPPSENVNQQHRIIKSSNSQQKQQLTPSVTQSQLQGVVSPPKANKPPLQFDKKLIMPKQTTSSQISIKVPQCLVKSKQERKSNLKSIEKPGTLTSPGQNDKQFTWKNQIELIVTQSDFENKRRQISHEKLKQIPKQQVQQLPFDQKRPTQPIIQQTQSHIIISQPRQPLQIQQIQKKQPFNPKQINMTQSQSQSQLQGSQPKCFTDFTMTSGRNDLQQLFSSMQLQLKEASQYAEQHPNLNMSEIQEQPDDVNSSFAQSTLYQCQK